MKEYMVQKYNTERWGDKWIAETKVKATYEDALNAMETAKKRRLEAFNNPAFKVGRSFKTPVEIFRIVEREVSEWKPVEETSPN